MKEIDKRALADILRRNGYVVFERTESTESLIDVIHNANLTVPSYNCLMKYYVETGKNIFDLIKDVEDRSIRRFRNIGTVRFKEIEDWVNNDVKSKIY